MTRAEIAKLDGQRVDRLLTMCRAALAKKDALAYTDPNRSYLGGLVDGYLAAIDLIRGEVDL